MEKQEPEKRISAEQKLEIRDEVERRFTHLPGETLKLIQGEVANRVAEKERFYLILASLIGLGLFVLFGISWNNLREKTKELIQRTGEVEGIQSNLLVRLNEITNMQAIAFERYHELTNRIHDLEGIDNIVTTKQLQKAFEQVVTIKSQADEALFTATTAAAESGDAIAYDRLQLWAKDRANQLAPQAATAVAKILMSSTGPFNKPYESNVRTTWDLKAGFQTARTVYMSSQPESRVSIIGTIGSETNFSIGDRMNFLVEVAQTDSTIFGRRLAVDLINSEAKKSFVVFRPDEISDWWKSNKTSYVSPAK